MNIKLAGLLIGLLSCSTAAAENWVIGANLGVAKGDNVGSPLNNQLIANGINASVSSSDDTRSAWQLFGAYQYTAAFGVELAYVDLGDVDMNFTGNASSIDAFMTSLNDVPPETAEGFRLSATWHYELAEKFQLQGKLGVFRWDSEFTYNGDSVVKKFKSSGNDISFGAVLEYTLTGNISANLAWDYYDIDSENVNLFSLGFSYRL